MQKIFLYTAAFISVTASFSCKKFLDQVPDDRQTIEEVFQKKGPSEQYLANVYSYVDDEANQWSNYPWTCNVDEAECSWAKYPIYNLNVGNWNAANAPFAYWDDYYRAIRSATYFINHIDGNQEILSLSGQSLIDQYKAEARFLRAYYYFLLMRQFGPVVLVGEDEIAPDAVATDVQKPRSPFDDCVAYVTKELDEAAAVLPLQPDADRDWGRATKGAALALKARLLLYAASPLYNGNTSVSQFRNADGTALINATYDKEKWKKAADAAKAVIDLGQYSLYKDPGGNPILSYRNMQLEAWNSETIFARRSNAQWDWDINSSPRSAAGWNGIAPVQEMVDAYFMKDGKSISESPLYSESGYTNGVFNMYMNREPRFYASISFNRSRYKGGTLNDSITLEFNYTGRDGKRSGGEDYSHTGYLVRKNVAGSTNRLTGQHYDRPLILFRLGEIYLDYAEAMAEYGSNEAEAVKYLNMIRERAGIPQYGTGTDALPVPTGQDLINKIRAERRVELAFEWQRWFDVRRWKIADQVMGDIHGMDVNKDGDDFYKRVVDGNHEWKDAYYWFPIPQYEMDRDPLLVQNPGW